jgi:chorismate mutase/prephenate dehydratase
VSEDSDNQKLDALRERIDRLDRALVDMLNERAQVVVEIGKIKRDTGGPIYAPARESAVLSRVLGANKGPLPDRCIERVYREIMSGSFALEQPLRIGYLGPEGSYSNVAARQHFGGSVDYEDLHTIEGVFTEVRRGHVDYGLVPIENSTGGGIVETLDAFQDARGEVFAYAEVQMAIRHNLLANCPPSAVERIYSKPEVFAQCRHWVTTQYPRAELIPAASSSRACQHVRDAIAADPHAPVAAIASALSAEKYELNVLFESIEDDPNNLTRFLVLSTSRAKPTGDDKTSLMFSTDSSAGTLVRVLNVFADAGVNLTHIDKRPTGRKVWNYTFFIDALGHIDDEKMQTAIEKARLCCQELTILGSYPVSRRVL